MAENTRAYPTGDAKGTLRAGYNNTVDARRPRGATRPSPHAIHGVLQWIDEAHATERTWARNTLLVVVILVSLLLAAVRLGLLGP